MLSARFFRRTPHRTNHQLCRIMPGWRLRTKFMGPQRTALDDTIARHCDMFRRALDRLRLLPSQNTHMILLRSSFGDCRLRYLLRCSICFDNPALGALMRLRLETMIVDCSLNYVYHQWLKSVLQSEMADSAISVELHCRLPPPSWLQPIRLSSCIPPSLQLSKHHPINMKVAHLWKFVGKPCLQL